MDRILIAILIGFTLSIPLSASDVVKEEPFPYWITTYAGQGNSSIAYADGFGSLVTNPAGFAREKEELSI